MDTERFNEEHAAKSRAVCERIEREDAERRGKLADLVDAQIKGELGRAKAEADGWRKIAERRLKHTDECEAALVKRNERIAELEKQVADLRAELANAEVLSGRERKILDMWPRFDDGKRVWFGDAFVDDQGGERRVAHIALSEGSACIADSKLLGSDRASGEAFKRPAPKVLDADGVEIKVGDTVWHRSGFGHGVVTSTDAGSIMGTVRYVNGGMEFTDVARYLTHTRPDSWERLEEDALKGVCEYAEAERKPGTIDAHTCCGCRFDEDGDGPSCEQQMALDIIRRAKALAGVEEARDED